MPPSNEWEALTNNTAVHEVKVIFDIFQNLLVCNPSRRLSAEDGMQHPYFVDINPAFKSWHA